MNENLKLEPEEENLLASFEADEWEPVPDQAQSLKQHREYARATFKKDRRVNIRISSKNLEALQLKAIEEGIPYQTLISSVLHKYVSGRLIERS